MSALPKISPTPEPSRLVSPDQRPLGFLIVDSSELSALALSAAIQQHGGDVLGWCATSQEAIEAIEKTRPDVVLIDVDHASSMDAIDCAHAILARVSVQIIFIAGSIDLGTQARIEAVPCSRVLGKPIAPDELCRIVTEVCGG